MRFCFQGDPEAVPEWNARCSPMGKEDAFCILSWNDWWTWITQWQRKMCAVNVIHFPSKLFPLQYIGSLPRRKKQGQYYSFHRAMDTTRQHDWLLGWYETNAGNEHTSSWSQLKQIKFKLCDLFTFFLLWFMPTNLPRDLRNQELRMAYFFI